VSHPLSTRRATLAHVSVCVGCCCGQTAKGHPAVPTDWLKAQWKTRRLMKFVQLTISGCLGPCDLTNVVSVGSAQGTTWLGNLDQQHHYDLLLDWATRVASRGSLQPLPSALDAHVFERFDAASVAAIEEYR